MISAKFRVPVLRVASVLALAGLAWMHGATVPAGAACVSHEAPSATVSLAASQDHQVHAAPMGDAAFASALPVEFPAVLAGAAAQPMGSHLAMACVAILVGLLMLAAASLHPFRTHVPHSRVQLVRRPVLRWPPPPDLAQLSILRT